MGMERFLQCLRDTHQKMLPNKALLSSKISPHHVVYKVVTPEAMNDFRQLRLNEKSIELLYNRFISIDRDGNGYACKYEFFKYLNSKGGLARTRFSRKVFDIFDRNDKGEINFHDFVISCWNFLPEHKDTTLRLSFVMYDVDRSGFLCEKEITNVLKKLYGKANYKENSGTKNVIDTLLHVYDGEVDFVKYTMLVSKYPILLWPTAQMQIALRQCILGINFWQQAMAHRIAEQKIIKTEISKRHKGLLKYKDVLSHLNGSAAAIDAEKFNRKILRRSSAAFLHQTQLTHQANHAVSKSALARKPQKTLSEKIERKSSQTRRITKKKKKLPHAIRPRYFKGRRRSSQPGGGTASKYAWTCKICGQLNAQGSKVCYVCRCRYEKGG